MENTILWDVERNRAGHYCHAFEGTRDSMESMIESFIEACGYKYSEAEYIEFFESMEVYYLPEPGQEENILDEEALYNFSATEYIRGTL